jgi:DNA polymerase-3 subunit beta
VKVLTIEEVAIRVENTIMTIEEGFNIFKITLGPNAKEFPVAVKDTKSGSITLDYPKFFKLLTEASGFTSNNVEGYKMLDGVYIQLDGNRFKATATDRSSMYHGEIKLSESYDAHNFIIPSSFISILKSMGKKDEKITINFSKERIWFSLGIIEVRCLLLTGKYPDWQKIVPRSHTIQIEFKKDELETGIKKIASVSKSNSRSAKLEISEKNTTFISMSIEYQQEARIVVPCSIEGEIKEEIIPQAEGEPKILKANTIGLNYHYIKNAIDVLGGERIYVRCSSQRKAAIFLGEGTDIEAFILIMPVTLPY